MLVCSNIFMTFAWYGHLKLQEMKISTGWPLILVILFSWGIAFFEYCLTVPANRIGTDWCIGQCRDLLAHGVPAVHFYTMGRSRNIVEILRTCF